MHLPDGSSKTVTIVGKVQLTPSLDLSTNQVVTVGKGSRCLYICKPIVDPIAFFASISDLHKSHLNYVPSTSLSKESFSNSVSKNVLDVQTFHSKLGHSFVSKLSHIPLYKSMDFLEFSYESFHSKEQIPSLLVSFFAYVKTHFQKQPKVIRSDNGTEIVNKTCAEFFQTHGVSHQKSMAYTLQHNGRVERKHRHLLDTARALRLQANLPLKFWGDCILTPTYLINKMPVKILD
ncbi:retrovirus-related pol polyprotein from transposon TNT 1-94 [Tanacetum coccineum]